MAFDPVATGKQLKKAGTQQLDVAERLKTTASFIDESVVDLADDGEVVGALEDVEAGTRSTRDLVGLPVAPLRAIAATLNSIRVPTVTVNSRNINIPVIGNIRVVTGVTVGSERPFVSVATSINDIADDLVNVKAALLQIANATKVLKQRMPEIRDGMTGAAKDMRTASKGMALSGNAMVAAGEAMGAP